MKLRNGFVSNSSSSNFVVSNKEPHVYPEPEEDLLSEDDMKKLRDYGFFELRDKHDKPQEFQYEVSCNQDDVIEFLLKNNIPFEAECHYGHYHVFFYPKKDLVIQAWNYGCEISTYGLDSAMEYFEDDFMSKERKEGVKKFTKKEYLDDIKL